MGKTTERLADLARRCGDLSPIAAPARAVLVDGNRARALAGVDVEGRPFAPLAASTRRRRKGTGPPGAPEGASSAIVTGYVVSVVASVGRLSLLAGWPGVRWIEYAMKGTRRMPRRDPSGFRREDLDRIRAMLLQHIKRGK